MVFGAPESASEVPMADRDRQAGERTGTDEGFLQRWSRRKAEARSAAVAAAEDPGVAAAGQPPAPPQISEPAPDESAPVAPEDLPDIDSLDASSDFSVFMRPGVPAHLRTQALRKLWRSDPIFSKLDGLLEYGEDYTIPSWPKGAIRTAYQIGRGFVSELEKLGDAEPRSEEAPRASKPAGDGGTASAPVVPADEPVETGGGLPESGAQSAEVALEPQPSATSVSTKPQRRPLPRRG